MSEIKFNNKEIAKEVMKFEKRLCDAKEATQLIDDDIRNVTSFLTNRCCVYPVSVVVLSHLLRWDNPSGEFQILYGKYPLLDCPPYIKERMIHYLPKLIELAAESCLRQTKVFS